MLGKNYLRAISYYRHSSSVDFYEGTHQVPKTGGPAEVSNSSFNFVGLAAAYGVTKRLTIELDAGYFINKTQVWNRGDIIEGSGFSNGTLTFKYGTIIRPVQQVELTTGFGIRFPFTANPQYVNGAKLNADVQPSTNAFGISEMLFFNKGFPAITLRLFSINRYEYNFRHKNDYIQPTDYKYGNVLLNSVFVSKKIMKYFFGILQVRNEWKTNDKDFLNTEDQHKVINSGYDLVTVSPQLSYSIAGKWNITVSYDIPVYKNYNGKQMTPAYSFALSLTRDFNLGKKQPTIQPAVIK